MRYLAPKAGAAPVAGRPNPVAAPVAGRPNPVAAPAAGRPNPVAGAAAGRPNPPNPVETGAADGPATGLDSIRSDSIRLDEIFKNRSDKMLIN